MFVKYFFAVIILYMDINEKFMREALKEARKGYDRKECPIGCVIVKDGKVYGVRTARGDEIHCDYVISGPYPNKVYSQMIEPLSEVPKGAIKMVNGRPLSVTPVSVIAVLEGKPEENGLMNYSTFSGTTPL